MHSLAYKPFTRQIVMLSESRIYQIMRIARIFRYTPSEVEKLPETKLPLAYHFLLELVMKEVEPQSPQAEFMKLSVEEQQALLSQQAEQMKAHYEQTASERTEWQTGDFIDACETRGDLVR